MPRAEERSVASKPEEEWCSSCTKEECKDMPKKLWLGATDAGARDNSPGQVGNRPASQTKEGMSPEGR